MLLFAFIITFFPEPELIDKKAKAKSANGKPSPVINYNYLHTYYTEPINPTHTYTIQTTTPYKSDMNEVIKNTRSCPSLQGSSQAHTTWHIILNACMSPRTSCKQNILIKEHINTGIPQNAGHYYCYRNQFTQFSRRDGGIYLLFKRLSLFYVRLL